MLRDCRMLGKAKTIERTNGWFPPDGVLFLKEQMLSIIAIQKRSMYCFFGIDAVK